MYAITVKQPWAEAIARHGKNVENRSRRPPAHLIGQRVAIHVGQAWDAWDAICADGLAPSDHPRLPPALLSWMDIAEGLGGKAPPPQSGRIIATARLVGWRTVDQFFPGEGHADGVLTEAAKRSPWFTGPVGWVLADVRALAVPVWQECDECGGDGSRDTDDGGNRRSCCCGGSGQMAIRGQVYPFALAPEIAAAVNAAPILIAEVERLQAVVEAARVATAKWPWVNHSRIKEGVPGTLYVNGLPQCPASYGRNPCECGADEANAARIEARRALSLEV